MNEIYVRQEIEKGIAYIEAGHFKDQEVLKKIFCAPEIRHHALFIIFILFVMMSVDASAYGQDWTKVSTPFLGQLAPYFLNADTGFLYRSPFFATALGFRTFSSSMDTPSLQRTTDGGNTWSNIEFFDSILV